MFLIKKDDLITMDMEFPYRKSRIESIKSILTDENIKVVYGPSGCGKTSFLSDIQEYLFNGKVPQTHIVLLNLKQEGLYDWRALNKKLKSYVKDGKKYFFLIDEVTEVEEFTKALLSAKDNYLCSIFITSSDQHLLLEEMEQVKPSDWHRIFLNTLSFNEVLQLYKSQKKIHDQKKVFSEYLYFGGYPDRFIADEDPEVFLPKFLRNDLYETLYKKHPHISFSRLLESSKQILNQSGKIYSGEAIRKILRRKFSIDRTTLDRYARHLENMYLIERVPVYIESGKVYERGGVTYYSLDNGLLTASGSKDKLLFLKTAIFNKLKLDGYHVSVVKTYRGIIDFRVSKEKGEAFIQVVDNLSQMNDEERSKIYELFKPIKSKAPKYVISTDSTDQSFMGIKNLNAVEFLCGKATVSLF